VDKRHKILKNYSVLESRQAIKKSDKTPHNDKTGGTGKMNVYQGNATSGWPLLNRVGNKVFRGNSSSGTPVFTIDASNIYAGNNISGTPVANMSSGRVYKGNMSGGGPLGNVYAGKGYKGNSMSGEPLVSGGDEVSLLCGIVYLTL
jgi:hypothetical protein